MDGGKTKYYIIERVDVMRLSEIRKIITENIGSLQITVSTHRYDNNFRIVKNIPAALIAIRNLKAVPSLKKQIELLENISEISTIHTLEEITIATSVCDNFSTRLSSLRTECVTILSLADSILPPMDKNTICIKLPTEINLQDLSKLATDFNSFFTIILSNSKIDGTVRFTGVESGSSWFYITVTGAATALVNIFINTIYNIFDKYISAKKSILTLQELEIGTRAKEDTYKILHILCEKEVKIINETESFNLDPELLGKQIRNIENLVKLLENGVEIRPSLTAPAEKQQNMNERITLLEEQVKNIKLLQPPLEDADTESADCSSTSNNTDSKPTGNEDSVE